MFLMSTLINPDSIVWDILEGDDLRFKSPEIVVDELEKYQELIEDKIESREEDFDYLISELFHNIDIISFDKYRNQIDQAKIEMESIDEKDTEFVALALKLDSAIWSDDKDFQKQDLVETWTTEELIDKINS